MGNNSPWKSLPLSKPTRTVLFLLFPTTASALCDFPGTRWTSSVWLVASLFPQNFRRILAPSRDFFWRITTNQSLTNIMVGWLIQPIDYLLILYYCLCCSLLSWVSPNEKGFWEKESKRHRLAVLLYCNNNANGFGVSPSQDDSRACQELRTGHSN